MSLGQKQLVGDLKSLTSHCPYERQVALVKMMIELASAGKYHTEGSPEAAGNPAGRTLLMKDLKMLNQNYGHSDKNFRKKVEDMESQCLMEDKYYPDFARSYQHAGLRSYLYDRLDEKHMN